MDPLAVSTGKIGGCLSGELLILSANALLLLGRLVGVLWIPIGEVLIEVGSDIPFSVGVGGSSGSSDSGAPGGGERRNTRPLNGFISSSSSAEGGGNGRGDGLFGVLRGLEAIAPVARRTGLHGWSADIDCDRCGSRLPASLSCCICRLSELLCREVSLLLTTDIVGASCEGRPLETLLRSRISGFDRARLAFVGDAKDGICRRADRFNNPSEDGGASEPPTGTLVVGDVFRRFGAEESIEYFKRPLLSNHGCSSYI